MERCVKSAQTADLHADDMNHWSSVVIADISMALCAKHSSCVRGMLGINPKKTSGFAAVYAFCSSLQRAPVVL